MRVFCVFLLVVGFIAAFCSAQPPDALNPKFTVLNHIAINITTSFVPYFQSVTPTPYTLSNNNHTVTFTTTTWTSSTLVFKLTNGAGTAVTGFKTYTVNNI